MRSTLHVPRLGTVTRDDSLGWYLSDPLAVPALRGRECSFALDGSYDDDPDPAAFHAAIANFLQAGPELLQAATPSVFRYYQVTRMRVGPGQPDFPVVATADEIWQHVSFGDTVIVGRRDHGDRAIYLSLECECDWEGEHGLQIVVHSGTRVNKVGPFDGHLSNADAFDDPRLEAVVFATG